MSPVLLALASGCGDDAETQAEQPSIYVCGNGQLEDGEECDDGNLMNGDRCSSTCKVSKVDVGVTINTCPTIDAFTVSPAQITMGFVATARVQASDADDDELTYEWTATSGTFTLPDQPETGYECESVGTHLLNIVVDDGHHCDDEVNIPVTCITPE